MKLTTRIFAALDIISLVFLGMQLRYVWNNFDRFNLFSEKLQSVLMFPVFGLILIGAFLHWYIKKSGFVLYYIQFPFRLYLWIFSIGFITLIPEALNYFEDFWFDFLFKVCFVGEAVRLFFSVKFHRQLLN
ncbi:MAG: hypothetical protein EOO99_00820 [Pedobacter sp.]|nr:MAG: hypothetical protein EOO99_00820 [Pedobacter sp.]